MDANNLLGAAVTLVGVLVMLFVKYIMQHRQLQNVRNHVRRQNNDLMGILQSIEQSGFPPGSVMDLERGGRGLPGASGVQKKIF